MTIHYIANVIYQHGNLNIYYLQSHQKGTSSSMLGPIISEKFMEYKWKNTENT